MFIVITISSIVAFHLKALLILLLTLPLLIMYLFVDKIITKEKKNKKFENDKFILSERKEVEFVKARSRKKGVSKEKTKEKQNIKTKKENKKQEIDEEIDEEIREEIQDDEEITKKEIIEERKKENKKKVKARNNKAKDKEARNRDGKRKKEKKGIGKKILIVFLSFALFCIVLAMAFLIYIVISTGSFDPEALKNQDQTLILDKDGEVFATLGAQKRESVTYDDLPQVLVDAIIATEDSRFYQHNGVDLARFLKASVLQLMGHTDAGGASTLTMQVVKNNLTDNSQSIIRKFKDVYLSVFFMEKKYTKEEIIELYVNDSCLGGTIYGVEEASQGYFGKSVSELTLPEAALIAGMYQAPNRYNPYKDPEAAYKRRETVLSLMLRHGYITKEEEEMANAVPIESMLVGTSAKEDYYQGYLDTVIEEVERETGNSPVSVSMKIYTALDRDIQEGLNKVLNGEAHTWDDDEVQAGIAVTNVNDGTIVAIGAGRNRTTGDFNRATQAVRQPGSTAKPLFDYGPGFEYSDFSTYTLFNDEPWGYTNGPSINNWDFNYEGLITLRRALSYSRNIPALKAFQTVGGKKSAEFAKGLGLDVAYSTSDPDYKTYDNGGDNVINEAYAIGGVSYGFTPLDMAEAYACFANGGYHIETHAVTKIEYRSTGEVVEFNKEKEKVMSDSTAYLVNNVLQYAVEAGFNGGARVYGSTVAAKTGTSNLPTEYTQSHGIPDGAVNDLWTVAYTPEYSVALWYGYDKADSSHYLSGASAPKDNLMSSIMQFIPKTTKKWEMPSSVVAVTVERETWPAQLPSQYTPDNMKITEYFKKGTQPTEVSQRYEKLNAVSNLQSTKTNSGYKITWDWKVPNVLDKAYLTKYFSNAVYGNQSTSYLNNRLNYNANTLGGNGFRIYEKNSLTGALKEIAYTEDTNYLYKPDKAGKFEIVVKAEYKSFKNNASDEKSITIQSDKSYTGTTEDPTNPSENKKLELALKGHNNTSYTQGSYNDEGITVTYNSKDVTSKATITYKLNNKEYTTIDELNSAVNELELGEYTITYSVTYEKETKTIKRTFKIIE